MRTSKAKLREEIEFLKIQLNHANGRRRELHLKQEYWKSIADEERTGRLRVQEALGTLAVMLHIDEISEHVYQECKATADVLINPSTGNRHIRIVGIGPQAYKALGWKMPEAPKPPFRLPVRESALDPWQPGPHCLPESPIRPNPKALEEKPSDLP